MCAIVPPVLGISAAAQADPGRERPTQNESIVTPAIKSERPWTSERMRGATRAPQPVDPAPPDATTGEAQPKEKPAR